MSTVYSLNTLGVKPLVSIFTSTFLLKTYDLILDIFLLSQPIHNHNVFGMNT
jgi:deoxyxylulose-5-phosphate synthase